VFFFPFPRLIAGGYAHENYALLGSFVFVDLGFFGINQVQSRAALSESFGWQDMALRHSSYPVGK